MNTSAAIPKNSTKSSDPLTHPWRMRPVRGCPAQAGHPAREARPHDDDLLRATRTETITLPPVAVSALLCVLAHLAAGRGVSVVPNDSEIELDDAALLAGLDPLDFLESLTRLGLPLRGEGGNVFIGTDVFAACLEVIETADARVTPIPDGAAGQARIADPTLAKELLTHRQWHFAERLAHDLRKAGNTRIPETYPLDYYFGTRPLLGVRPTSWPRFPPGRRVEAPWFPRARSLAPQPSGLRRQPSGEYQTAEV